MKIAAVHACRISALALAVFALAGSAAAQDMQFGVKGGLSLAKFGGEDNDLGDVEPDIRTGVAAGAFLSFPLGDRVSLQPEALFVQKGAAYALEDIDATLKVDYVEVPLFLKARLGGDGIRPYLLAGPYVGFRVKAEGEGEVDDENTNVTDLEDETKSTDYGVTGGVGVEFGSDGAFLLEARYTRGLTSVDAREEEEANDIKNSAWLFLVGFRF
jgi:hypothetical protein